jgi:WD40 repeat protein
VAAAHSNADDGGIAVRLYDIASGDWSGSLTGPAGYYCCSLQFDPSGRWLAALQATDSGAQAVVWDVAAGGSPISFGPAYDLELGADGTSVVVGNGPQLTVYAIASGEPVRTIETTEGVEYWDFELDATGTRAVLVSTAEFARQVDVVDIVSGELVETIKLRDPSLAQFSGDGRALAVTGGDSLIRVFDTDGFVEQQRLAGTSGTPSFPRFSPDGTRVASARLSAVSRWRAARSTGSSSRTTSRRPTPPSSLMRAFGAPCIASTSRPGRIRKSSVMFRTTTRPARWSVPICRT